MSDSIAVHLHIDRPETLPEGYADAISAIFDEYTTDITADPSLDDISGVAFVGTRNDIANALCLLMKGGTLPAHQFSFTVYEEPHHEELGTLLRYTPGVGDFEAACTNTGEVLRTFADIGEAIASTTDRTSLVAALEAMYGETEGHRRSTAGE
ncbi:hypothetical protein FHR83_005392 [Actinoplanes campanulatus]|uniref:Uncharacterized protein n=1 Tax=Actinoplanes campanulatus TaxID=113559 RepID=A0A7W5AK10_9ACTN|nr:hypothetical protein [Actinoplanes campanulatus]MBB3097708.1 hypothetical protein [Actinoplanes campanulatus]GGN37889.1 hypothetical protein GCM10010109_64300 [Actinoplanes campanulatus]GID39724.1 hypothetical protein Aca09nite_62300 [Actinoplanes campanulatus]